MKRVQPLPGARPYLGLDRVDLSSQMPPVGDQGMQGSCTAWGVAYYHKTHLEWIEHHWDVTQTRYQFSPAFTYNQINGGVDQGSSVGDAFALLCEQGCASMADCPYNQNNATSWPSESAYSHALWYRSEAGYFVMLTDTTGLNQVKQLLNNGYSSVFAIFVWGNFDEISRYGNIYCVSDRTGSNRGGHVVTCVGYDDTLITHDGRGAFKLVNSWGTGWGASGYFWMSYQAVMDELLSQRVAYYMTDLVGYAPRLIGRVRIQHTARDRIGIQALVGPRSQPVWTKDFRTWRWPKQNRSFPNNNLVFDFTDGASYLEDGTTDSISIAVRDDSADGRTGYLRLFSGQHLIWDGIKVATDTPVAIPDQAEPAYLSVCVLHADRDIGIARVIAPASVVDSGRIVLPRVQVRNHGTTVASFPVSLRIGTEYADSQYVE
ncbi:MAG: C1 family peptidase, partial [candidate division WOR-3 bacterium]